MRRKAKDEDETKEEIVKTQSPKKVIAIRRKGGDKVGLGRGLG